MQIEIPDPLFKRLQVHAVPLVDSTASVIEKLLDAYEGDHIKSNQNGEPPQLAEEVRQFDPNQPPDLLHSRVRGQFGGVQFSNWNDLVRIAHVEAFKKKAKSFDALRSATLAQIKKDQHEYAGYHYVPDIGISIQGVDANHAWRYSLRLAQYLRVALRAEVEWRNNSKAEHPGERGILSWSLLATSGEPGWKDL